MNRLINIGLCVGILLIEGCSSSQLGMQCTGEIKTLLGDRIGNTSAVIVDNIHAFSIVMPKSRIDSGLLYSADSARYMPSAVTREGYLAQRLSSKSFCIVNPAKNEYTTYHCQ